MLKKKQNCKMQGLAEPAILLLHSQVMPKIYM